MKRLRSRQRGRIILVVALAAITSSTGLAEASPSPHPNDAALCTLREGAGVENYQRCLARLAANRNGGDRRSADPSDFPTISATSTGTSTGTDDQPPVYFFCSDPSRSQFASITPIEGCTQTTTLVCVRNSGDSRYHCVDHRGAAADPPGGICTTNPHFACKNETASSTTTVAPSSPTPHGQEPPATSTSMETPPGAPDPTTTPDPTPSVSSTGLASPSADSTATPSASATSAPPVTADDPVGQALTKARAYNLRTWLESDLVKAWRGENEERQACNAHERHNGGCDTFEAAVRRLAQHARQPGVVGVKIAFDLGLRGDFADDDEIVRFLIETSRALRGVFPARRLIAVDLAIPELGCGDHEACRTAMRRDHPLITLAKVEKYTSTGASTRSTSRPESPSSSTPTATRSSQLP
ncbi:hypothetical protein [Nonomuraea sp. KM90]|uniref:hypothetical protein n=1 Tax=Nonomuraea sp. KM90 TaxID=3457428 RepID=UPI003FCE5FC1